MAGTRRLTLREASEALGVSVEAVRKRVKRGSLQSDKDPDGRVFVYLDASPDAGGDAYQPQPEVEGSQLVEELRDRIAYLERQVEEEREARREESRELRRLLAGLIERVPQLEAPQQGQDQAQEPQQQEAGEQDRGEPESRPWWRRVFGG